MRKNSVLGAVFFVFLFFGGALWAASEEVAENNHVPPVIDFKAGTINTVVIDPGHGGGDWGVTIRGTHEKDINLKIARLAAEKINSGEKGIRAILTRKEDDFLRAKARAGFANKNNASVFISIHCDYVPAAGAEGYKIYYMRGLPLSEEKGEKEAEGKADEKEKVKVKKWAEVQRYHINESLELAGYISQYMQAALMPEESSVTGNDRDDLLPFVTRREMGVRSYILAGVDAPAIQVEVGNMNNERDLSFLREEEIYDRVAYHIKEGVIHYFRDREIEKGKTEEYY